MKAIVNCKIDSFNSHKDPEELVKTALAHITTQVDIKSITAKAAKSPSSPYPQPKYPSYSGMPHSSHHPFSQKSFSHTMGNQPSHFFETGIHSNPHSSIHSQSKYGNYPGELHSNHFMDETRHPFESSFKSHTTPKYDQVSYDPFKKETIEVVIEFDVRDDVFNYQKKDKQQKVSEAQKMIKDAISLRGYLEFVKFDDIPMFFETNFYKPNTNPQYTQTPFSFSHQPNMHFDEEKSGESSEVTSSFSNTNPTFPPFIKSPVSFVGDAHGIVLKALQAAAKGKEDITGPFFESIGNEDYSQAIRRASTTKDPIGFKLIKIIYIYESLLALKIDINQTAGKEKRSAIHYAAINGDISLFEFLKAKGAKTNEPDLKEGKGQGKTAEQYMLAAIEKSLHPQPK